jgi:lycopene cyclase domain-containing protein
MPGLYLIFLVLSAAGLATLDARYRLAFWAAPARTAAAVGIGTAFFLAWDAVGIATGIFVKGDSPLLLGLDLAPHLPLEEPVFLAFLCYLAVLVHAAVLRRLSAGPAAGRDRAES